MLTEAWRVIFKVKYFRDRQGPKFSNDKGGASRALSSKTPTLQNFGDEKPNYTLLRMRVVYHWERGNAYLRCIRVRKLVTHEDNSNQSQKPTGLLHRP